MSVHVKPPLISNPAQSSVARRVLTPRTDIDMAHQEAVIQLARRRSIEATAERMKSNAIVSRCDHRVMLHQLVCEAQRFQTDVMKRLGTDIDHFIIKKQYSLVLTRLNTERLKSDINCLMDSRFHEDNYNMIIDQLAGLNLFESPTAVHRPSALREFIRGCYGTRKPAKI